MSYYPSSTRRRIVCLNCREKNIACEVTSQPPSTPCARCTRKGLVCQYITVSATPKSTPTPTPRPAPSPSAYYNAAPAPAPSLPCTAPPPMHSRPRYSAGAYPDLSLPKPGPVTPRAGHAQLPTGSTAYGYAQPQPQGYAYAPSPAAPAYPTTPYTSSNHSHGPGYAYQGQHNNYPWGS
ncbi:hypothetical protein B0H19DRAFT_1269141 [Mycena capillaripes]|nr:hypothetical protein B0H19DRAFT_1269141 [Mycena capillaripes]